MPDVFPLLPVPSSISAPAYIDPGLRFRADSGDLVQRPRTSRPRRRYTCSWLGKRTDELHTIVDFLLTHRFGLTTFSWIHMTAHQPVTFANTTPVIVTYPTPHNLLTGFWLWVVATIPVTALQGVGYRVTRLNNVQVSLDGSVAQGSALTGSVTPYLHSATCVLPEDTWESPTKLIGPEIGTQGFWSLQLTVEELFA